MNKFPTNPARIIAFGPLYIFMLMLVLLRRQMAESKASGSIEEEDDSKCSNGHWVAGDECYILEDDEWVEVECESGVIHIPTKDVPEPEVEVEEEITIPKPFNVRWQKRRIGGMGSQHLGRIVEAYRRGGWREGSTNPNALPTSYQASAIMAELQDRADGNAGTRLLLDTLPILRCLKAGILT